jgi:serine/threonine-protein kinase
VAACLALAALGAATHQALAPGTSAARAPAPSDEAAGPLPPVERQRHSIAVLPFTNRGTVDGDDYFSDGLTDEITAALTKVSGLRVASRSSAFAFRERGQDARAVGRRLRVRYVLAGSVQRAGGRLRVRAELADAASGFAVWSDTYDRELRDVFAVQEEIAQSIMRALRLTLADGGPARLAEPPTADLGAHDLYLRGLYFRNKQSADGVRRGVALLEQATARDTGFALAYVALAEAYRLLPNYAGVGSMREALPKARRAATRALALDGTLPEAHASVGMIAALDHDWETAEQAYRQALALRPGSGITHYYYALLLFSTGRIAEARAEAERALATDPTSIPFNNLLGYMLYFSRRYDEAATQARRTLELEPDLPVAHCILGRVHMQQRRAAAALAALHTCARAAGGGMEWGDLGYAYVLAGQPERARELLGELDQRADGGFVSPIDRAKIHTALGEREQAVEWLERGYADREMNMRDLALEPLFDPLRMEPRFSALLRRMRVK